MSDISNSKGSVYSTSDWLNGHFSIKSEGRYDLVSKLPIYRGDNVLDLGCANGSWTRLIAERVGSTGTVLAVDHDSSLIEQARTSTTGSHLGNRVTFDVLDVKEGICSLNSSFDLITIFNVASLIENPKQFLKDVTKLLNPTSGRLILKDSALASDFYWPLDAEVAKAITLKHAKEGRIKGYDPNFALKSYDLLEAAGMKVVDVISSAYTFTYPYSNVERAYISQNAQMISEMDGVISDSDRINHWVENEMAIDGSFFENRNSMYTATEFSFVCSRAQ